MGVEGWEGHEETFRDGGYVHVLAVMVFSHVYVIFKTKFPLQCNLLCTNYDSWKTKLMAIGQVLGTAYYFES